MRTEIKEELNLNQLILPSYVEQFQCMQCGRCCRRNWRIAIDEDSYQCLRAEYAAQGKENELELMIENDTKGKKIRFSD